MTQYQSNELWLWYGQLKETIYGGNLYKTICVDNDVYYHVSILLFEKNKV